MNDEQKSPPFPGRGFFKTDVPPPKTRKVSSDEQLQVLKVVLCSLKISNHGLVFMSARCTMYSPWASMLEVVKVGLFKLFANSTTGKVPTNNELPSQRKSGNR